MNNRYYTLAMPGGVTLIILLLCLLQPSLFHLINPVYLWIALSTIGIPTLVAAGVFSAISRASNVHVSFLPLTVTLMILTLPSTIVVMEFWLYLYPEDGPGVGYMGIFYIGTAVIWLPLLILWSWWTTRKV